MTPIHIICGIAAACLLIYLLAALLWPEKF